MHSLLAHVLRRFPRNRTPYAVCGFKLKTEDHHVEPLRPPAVNIHTSRHASQEEKTSRVGAPVHVFSSGAVVTKVESVPEHDWLEVTWEDGQVNRYPFLWLRDNCTCPACFNEPSQSRVMLLSDLDLDTVPSSVHVNQDKGEISLVWSNGHESNYTFAWLEGHSFSEGSKTSRRQWLPRKPKLWSSEMQDQIPIFDFTELESVDRTLYEWITQLQETGLTLVKNSPCIDDTLNRIGERVAMLRRTNYGETFEVKAKLEPSNAAYTRVALGLHTDLPYYYYTPGIQMLHCIKQTPVEGGENQLADGFRAAEVLQERHPEMFQLLSTRLVDFIDYGSDRYKFFKLTRQPIIGLDEDGQVIKITFNNQVRDSYLDMSIQHVTPFYRALRTFNDILYDKGNHIGYKLEEGDIVCFHNYRVLHGRSGYRVTSGGERHLQGAYIDWDELNSRRRVLMLELGILN